MDMVYSIEDNIITVCISDPSTCVIFGVTMQSNSHLRFPYPFCISCRCTTGASIRALGTLH